MLQIFRAGWQPLLNHRAGWGSVAILKISEHGSKEDNNIFQARLKCICYMIVSLTTSCLQINSLSSHTVQHLLLNCMCMWQCHQTASSILEPALQWPSHASPSRAGGCQGGKAGGRALCQPWATGHREVRATASRQQLSLPGERGSPLGHWGLSLPWPSTPAQVIGKCSSHSFNSPSDHSSPSGKGGKQMHIMESIVQGKRPAHYLQK